MAQKNWLQSENRRSIVPNIALVLKEEIRRLARKELKFTTAVFHKELVRVKKIARDLRRQLTTLAKNQTKSVRTAAAPSKDAGPGLPWVRKSRMTGKTIRELRARLNLTQAELAKLLNVSALAVYQWEHSEGTLNLRKKSREALLTARTLGQREARRRISEGPAKETPADKPRRGRPRKSKSKNGRRK
jgi:DNA-binding XRE family transcriptional regulator